MPSHASVPSGQFSPEAGSSKSSKSPWMQQTSGDGDDEERRHLILRLREVSPDGAIGESYLEYPTDDKEDQNIKHTSARSARAAAFPSSGGRLKLRLKPKPATLTRNEPTASHPVRC